MIQNAEGRPPRHVLDRYPPEGLRGQARPRSAPITTPRQSGLPPLSLPMRNASSYRDRTPEARCEIPAICRCSVVDAIFIADRAICPRRWAIPATRHATPIFRTKIREAVLPPFPRPPAARRDPLATEPILARRYFDTISISSPSRRDAWHAHAADGCAGPDHGAALPPPRNRKRQGLINERDNNKTFHPHGKH